MSLRKYADKNKPCIAVSVEIVTDKPHRSFGHNFLYPLENPLSEEDLELFIQLSSKIFENIKKRLKEMAVQESDHE